MSYAWLDDPFVAATAGGPGDPVGDARPARPTPPGGCRLRRVFHALLRPLPLALRAWLDSWVGIGRIAVGKARQGYDFQLTRYDEKGWRATFYTTGMEHSATSALGTAWERMAWDCGAARSVGRRSEDAGTKPDRAVPC